MSAVKRRKQKLGAGDRAFNIVLGGLTAVSVVVILYPLIFVLVASISDPMEIFQGNVWLWPKGFNLEAYKQVFRNGDIFTGYKNTLIYTVVGTLITIIITFSAAYPLSRKKLYGRSKLMGFFLFTMFFSGGMIPTYLMVKNLGLYNTMWAVILVGTVSVYNIIVARTFMQNTIPEELYEAASMDGCGDIRVFFKMSIAIVKKEEMAPQYDANGFSRMEMLPGTFPGAHNYKCFLKAGHDVQPEKYADKTAVYCFTAGKGYVTTDKFARNITELAFFVPDFDNGDFTIHAVEDLEFLCLVLDMTEGDHKNYAACHTTLPIFRSFSETHEYTQDCKGPHTRSWQVLYSGEVGRNLLGVVKAVGEGTVEKGHPAVDQWNYGLDNADFTLTVENESVAHHAGDWSFVPAGLDHSLTAEPGKEVAYIWFERFVKEREA